MRQLQMGMKYTFKHGSEACPVVRPGWLPSALPCPLRSLPPGGDCPSPGNLPWEFPAYFM